MSDPTASVQVSSEGRTHTQRVGKHNTQANFLRRIFLVREVRQFVQWQNIRVNNMLNCKFDATWIEN